jgi:hypothetical protein
MLTRTRRNLLQQLYFRENGVGEPCWIVGTSPSSRYVLLVRTLMGSWERHSRVSITTLRALHTAGLIAYSDLQTMPAWWVSREDESALGRQVTITDKGRQAIGKGTK